MSLQNEIEPNCQNNQNQKAFIFKRYRYQNIFRWTEIVENTVDIDLKAFSEVNDGGLKPR